jgi:hypothetical protein
MATSVNLPFGVAVVGISNYQASAATIAEGDHVFIRREPDNPYDANACRVERDDGETLGYVPRALAARLVDRAEPAWRARVEAKLAAKGTIGLRIMVEAGHDMGPDSEPAVATPSAPVPSHQVVVKRSGRPLGRLVRIERDLRRVVVDNGTGEVAYPDGLVDIVG